MTIAISLKVNDGVVLATDSASTMKSRTQDGKVDVINIYNNANKLFNLHKRLPIGAVVYGSGSIGHASISTLAKDFRKRITEGEATWKVDPSSYTVEEVVQKFKKFIYDDSYLSVFKNWKSDFPLLGFIIVGYSVNESLPEVWTIDISKDGTCSGPILAKSKDQIGWNAGGAPEAISRLYFGYSMKLRDTLVEAGLDDPIISKVLQLCKARLETPFVVAPMPIQDAIDLAVFLVETTINYTKYAPGDLIVGGPIEVAAITKHEGFKWIQRKHYYKFDINKTEV